MSRFKLYPLNAAELALDDQDLLYALNAITRHPQNSQTYCPTVGGLILFGKAVALQRYFPMHRIDYLLISGTEWVADPNERYKGVTEIREPLLLAIPRLTTLVINDLPKSFHLDENGLQRQETPLIPRNVIREAIVNAVMHRNYRAASPVQIIRYADRLEIHNPGYSLKPIDEIDQPGSLSRNEKIAAVLHETGFAETKGTGGKVMLETMREANLTIPKFNSQREKDCFCLTLWHHNLLSEEDTVWLKQFRDHGCLSNEDARALVIVRQEGRIDNWMYRVANGVDTLDASRKLTRLRDIGLLESNGRGRATYYTLAPKFLSGELEPANQGSSTGSESLSGELVPGNQESTTDNQESSTSESLQLELKMPFTEIPQPLREKIQALGKLLLRRLANRR
ncbi:MAG: ATP-binding protein [Thermosynechococcaceae cyanobacterium]